MTLSKDNACTAEDEDTPRFCECDAADPVACDED